MRELFKSFSALLSNTRIEMEMKGWPATVSVLGICGVIITAVLSVTGNIEGGGNDE